MRCCPYLYELNKWPKFILIHTHTYCTSFSNIVNDALNQWCQTDPVKGYVAAGFHSNQARTHLIWIRCVLAWPFIGSVWHHCFKRWGLAKGTSCFLNLHPVFPLYPVWTVWLRTCVNCLFWAHYAPWLSKQAIRHRDFPFEMMVAYQMRESVNTRGKWVASRGYMSTQIEDTWKKHKRRFNLI